MVVRPCGASPSDDPRFSEISLGSDDLVLALPADHRSAHLATIELSDLREQEWISTLEGDACDQLLHQACGSAGFRPVIRHRASDWTAILALVEVGMGVALVPRAARLPVPESVVLLTINGYNTRRHLYAAIRRGTDAGPAIAGYIAALKAAASAAEGDGDRTGTASALPGVGMRAADVS